jgi:hypothetical protein
VTFFIPGPLPCLNDMIAQAKGCGGRGRRYSSSKKQWTWTCATLAKASGLKHMDCVRIGFHWVEQHKRRNPDNIAAAKKYVLDGLVQAGILDNDGWSQIDCWADTFAVGPRPGVHVTVEPVGK